MRFLPNRIPIGGDFNQTIEIRVRVRFGNGLDLEIRRSFRFGVVGIRDPSDSEVIGIRSRDRFGNGWDLGIRRSFRFGMIEIRVRIKIS